MLSIVSQTGANITSIDHQREDKKSEVGVCVVEMLLETRNADHVAEIRTKLTENGYELID
jgi:threonine dehydratase